METEKNKPPKKKKIFLDIYLPGDHLLIEDIEDLVNASGEYLEILGFEPKAKEEPVFGSFWQRLKFLFKKNITADELANIFRITKRSLERKHVDLPTAEQTEKLAIAAEKLVAALEKFNEGVVRLGAIIVLKKIIDGEPRLIVHQLNNDAISYLDNFPEAMSHLDWIHHIINNPSFLSKPDVPPPAEDNSQVA